jgi:hypothetical protein
MKDGEKLQIGNWIAEKVEMDGVDFMEVRTTDGGFRIMYRMDCMMYMAIDSVSMKEKEAIQVLLNNVLATANLLDAGFQHDVMIAIGKVLDRVKSKPVSDEEDAKILAEERAKYEIKKEMEEEDGGNREGESPESGD